MVRKVELARALTGEHDLLMLDEPTNHLDLSSIEWLQDILVNTASAVALVTHDRYFLEAVCTGIYEIDNGTLYAYDGNYSVYLEKRAEETRCGGAPPGKNRIDPAAGTRMAETRSESTGDKRQEAERTDISSSRLGGIR